MIDRLYRTLEHIDEPPPELQEQLAEIIEQHTEPVDFSLASLAGAWSDQPTPSTRCAGYDTPCKPANAADRRAVGLNGRR